MLGVVLILLALLVAGPVAVMFGGAVWSALLGWSLADEATERAERQPA